MPPAKGRRSINAAKSGRRCVALLAVLLDTRGAQARESVLVNRVLPGEEFLDCKRIAAARLFKRQQAAAHCCDHFSLAADDPTLGAGSRQIGDGQRTAIRSDDILGPRSK